MIKSKKEYEDKLNKRIFETQYKQRHEMFTNDIITKRDTVSITLYRYYINIVIKNDVETLKEFKLKEKIK